MGIITSQQLQNYYDFYRDKEVTYTKEVLRTLAVDPRQIYVKCNGAQWPCIINSTSFQIARIIVGTKGGAYAAMAKKDPPPVSLRFYFIQQHDQPISFFVTGRITDISPYMNSTELAVITLTFTQRPPDDLIEKIGSMLEANSNAIRRKDERIIITDDAKRRMNMTRDETIIFIQNVPRRCILRDISFSGAKVILLGIEKFIQGKETILRIHFDEPDEIIQLAGHVVKTSPVEGRPEIIYACLQFDEAAVPTSYRIRINTYLTSMRKTILNTVQQQQENSSTQKPAAQEAGSSTPSNTGSQPEASSQTEGTSPAEPATQPVSSEVSAQETEVEPKEETVQA
ncbi:MAG: PilZ domain-containing protein [Treponema sp.]|uniref:PilZ domain-containing protein n=1 Tax=Treponema sp. TaxID=166 RepID=UPI00298E8648|nr:PilZ domain-containing protein [Treponema sp.]MCI5696710.1 PilZ domain-containing protein [Spirochaetia bacterium]MDD5812006.1 PilZ domain-containing protein [Treponema sp.]MDY5885632.1 PilZ domain-containing protein [Treponema sp.]